MAKKIVAKREIVVTINKYELMIILNPELRESDIKKKLKEITDMIEKADGKITHEDFWGKRDFAYRIKGNGQGHYMVYNMELPNVFLAELKEHLRIEKEVIRSIILKLPEDHVYTSYDLDAPVEKPKPSPSHHQSKRNVSIKHNPPVAKKEEKVKEEPKKETKDVDEKELDKKLDEVIGGEDLKL